MKNGDSVTLKRVAEQDATLNELRKVKHKADKAKELKAEIEELSKSLKKVEEENSILNLKLYQKATS